MKRRRETPRPRWTIDAYETDGGETRLFYVFLPGRLIVLLEGEVKKRDDIPPRTLARMRVLQAEVAGRGAAPKIREAKR
jgi:hypothetical protein